MDRTIVNQLRVNCKSESLHERAVFAENISRKHIDKMLADINGIQSYKNIQDGIFYSFQKNDSETWVNLCVENPIKSLSSVFRKTKEKGWGERPQKLARLISLLAKMETTPDISLRLEVSNFKYLGKVPILQSTTYDFAIIEVKNGHAQLSPSQIRDAQLAKDENIPYFLMRVDDSNFLQGEIALALSSLNDVPFVLPK